MCTTSWRMDKWTNAPINEVTLYLLWKTKGIVFVGSRKDPPQGSFVYVIRYFPDDRTPYISAFFSVLCSPKLLPCSTCYWRLLSKYSMCNSFLEEATYLVKKRFRELMQRWGSPCTFQTLYCEVKPIEKTYQDLAHNDECWVRQHIEFLAYSTSKLLK